MGVTLTDVLLFGKAQSDDVDNATLVIYRRNILRWSALGGYLDVIVKGVAPLSLPDAIANSLSYVKAFGGTMQGVPQGYTLLNGITNGANTAVATGIQPTVDDVEWELRVKPSTDSWYILQARSGSQSIWGISGSQTGQTILLGWNGNQSLLRSDIVRNTTHTYYVKGTVKNGVATLYVKDETNNTEDTQTTTYTFDATQLPSSQFYLFANGNPQYVAAGNTVYMARIKVGGVTVMDYVPALNPSNVVGFYDNATGDFKVSSVGTLTADQTIVPTPTAPIDIVCNNGVLKYGVIGKNLFDPTKVLFGYYRDRTTGDKQQSSSNFISSDDGYIPCLPNTTYTFVGTNKTSGTYSKYNTIYFFDSAKNYLGASPYEISQPTTGTTPNNCYYLQVRSNPLDNSTPIQDAFAQFNWQLEQGSTVTAYEPYQVGIYTDGTVETIADSANHTATVATLLGVGDYRDTQNINTGAITRNVGVKVFDGTESFVTNVITGCYALEPYIGAGNFGDKTVYSSHLKSTAAIPAFGSRDGYAFIVNAGDDYTLAFGGTGTWSSLSAFKQFLADQYAAGTPVIVVYPLKTPTTESVAGQTLQVQAGDNTLEITQASLSGLELEAQYQAAVSLTIQEVQDANLDPNVEVTIN